MKPLVDRLLQIRLMVSSIPSPNHPYAANLYCSDADYFLGGATDYVLTSPVRTYFVEEVCCGDKSYTFDFDFHHKSALRFLAAARKNLSLLSTLTNVSPTVNTIIDEILDIEAEIETILQ